MTLAARRRRSGSRGTPGPGLGGLRLPRRRPPRLARRVRRDPPLVAGPWAARPRASSGHEGTRECSGSDPDGETWPGRGHRRRCPPPLGPPRPPRRRARRPEMAGCRPASTFPAVGFDPSGRWLVMTTGYSPGSGPSRAPVRPLPGRRRCHGRSRVPTRQGGGWPPARWRDTDLPPEPSGRRGPATLPTGPELGPRHPPGCHRRDPPRRHARGRGPEARRASSCPNGGRALPSAPDRLGRNGGRQRACDRRGRSLRCGPGHRGFEDAGLRRPDGVSALRVWDRRSGASRSLPSPMRSTSTVAFPHGRLRWRQRGSSAYPSRRSGRSLSAETGASRPAHASPPTATRCVERDTPNEVHRRCGDRPEPGWPNAPGMGPGPVPQSTKTSSLFDLAARTSKSDHHAWPVAVQRGALDPSGRSS